MKRKLFENLAQIHLKIDQKDKDILKQLAKNENLSLSEYLRKRGLLSIRELLYEKYSTTYELLEFLISNNIIPFLELEAFVIKKNNDNPRQLKENKTNSPKASTIEDYLSSQ